MATPSAKRPNCQKGTIPYGGGDVSGLKMCAFDESSTHNTKAILLNKPNRALPVFPRAAVQHRPIAPEPACNGQHPTHERAARPHVATTVYTATGRCSPACSRLMGGYEYVRGRGFRSSSPAARSPPKLRSPAAAPHRPEARIGRASYLGTPPTVPRNAHGNPHNGECSAALMAARAARAGPLAHLWVGIEFSLDSIGRAFVLVLEHFLFAAEKTTPSETAPAAVAGSE